MKKFRIRGAATLAVLLVMLAGCGQGQAPEADPSVGQAQQQAQAAPPKGLALTADDKLAKAAANGPAKCNIEFIGGKSMEGGLAAVPPDARTSVVGWYADPVGKTPGRDLVLVVQDQALAHRWKAAVPARTDRGDVDTALQGGGALVESGFSFDIDLSQFPAGSYGLYLTSEAGVCGFGTMFEIR